MSRAPFPNDVGILKPKVGLRPNQIEIDLRKVIMKNITYFWKNNFFFWKIKATKTLGHRYAYTRMCTHALDLCVDASYMCTHTQACVCMLKF